MFYTAISYIWLAPLDLFVGLLAFPLAPVIVAFTGKDGLVPLWAYYWMTDDNPIDGDDGHLARWAVFVAKWPRFGMYCRRVAWLWRNRGYNFSASVCGKSVTGPTRFWGNRGVSDNPMSPGMCCAYNSGLWELYIYVPYPYTSIGLRIRLGWKLPLTVDIPEGVSMMVEYINPFKGYKQQ